MLSWGKSTSFKPNVENLTAYATLSNQTAVNFGVGDYVLLKTAPYLPEGYINSRNKAVVGYVLSLSRDSSGHIDLGNARDLVIAYELYGKIGTATLDSRMFYKASAFITFPKSVLNEFVADTPISEIKIGTLVRARIYTTIDRESSTSANWSSLSPLSPPFMVITQEGTSVILAGQNSNGIIEEIKVPSYMVCEYREPINM